MQYASAPNSAAAKSRPSNHHGTTPHIAHSPPAAGLGQAAVVSHYREAQLQCGVAHPLPLERRILRHYEPKNTGLKRWGAHRKKTPAMRAGMAECRLRSLNTLVEYEFCSTIAQHKWPVTQPRHLGGARHRKSQVPHSPGRTCLASGANLHCRAPAHSKLAGRTAWAAASVGEL